MTTEFKLAIKLEYDGKAVTSGLDASRTGVVNFRQTAVTAADSIAVSFKNVQTSGTAVGATFNQVAAQITQNTAAISANTAAIKQQAAAQLEASRAAAAAAAARLAATKTAAADLGSLEKSTAAVGMSARATAAALRQVPAQVTDIVVGLQAGQSPLTVLLQQGGQLKDVFGGVGPAVRALGGYVLGLISPLTVAIALALGIGLAFNAGQKEGEAYSRAIIISGNAAGTTSDKLQQYARNISAVAGTQGAAAEALATFAQAGTVADANLQQAADAALRFEKATGQAVGETAKQFSELAKSPLEASVKLNQSYNFLTASVYEQIKALQEQGKTTEAATLAQTTYAETLKNRSAEILQNIGFIEKRWLAVKAAIAGVVDATLNLGREATAGDKINEINAKLLVLKTNLQDYVAKGFGDDDRLVVSARKQIAALEQLRGSTIAGARAKEEAAAATAKEAAATQLKAKFDKEGEKFESNSVKLKRELAQVEADGQRLIGDRIKDNLKPLLTQAELNERIAAVKKKYRDTDGESALENALSAELALYKGYADDRTAILAGAEKSAESLRKQGLLDERQLANALFRIRDDALVDQIAIAELSAATAGGKKQKAEQQRFLGEVAKLNTQREVNERAHNDRLAEIDAEQSKRIREKVADWALEGEAAKKALAVEYALYGQTAEARAVALAGIKLETEAEKLIADAKRAGIPFSEAQATSIRAEAAARGQNAGAIAGEQQALAGAQQLREANRRFAAESILDEDARARALVEIDADVWRQRIALAGEGTEAQKKLIAEFTVYYQNQLDKPFTDRWKATVERFDSTFRQGFTRLLEGGKDKWSAFNKSIMNAFKTEVADQIYRTFLKPFVVKVIGSFLGMDAASAGVPGAEGGGSGIAGTASNLYSLASSASSLVTIGSQVAAGTMSLANAAGTYFANATNSGISGLLATNGAYGTAAGAGGASGFAGYGAGLGIALVGAIAGNIISGGYSAIGKNPNAAIGIGAAIGSIVPGIGTAIGAAIGAVIGGLVNRFFGRKLTETGIKGTFDASGFNGVNYTYEKGGLFRSDREREQGPVDNETTNLLNQAFGAVKNSVAGLAAQLGVGRQAIDSFTTNVRLNFKDLDEAGISKLLDDTLSGIGNQLADAVLAQTAGLKELAIRGETSVQTLGRLAEFITTVNGVVDFLNIGLFDLSVTGVKAAQSFVELFGGLENFGRVTGVYYENFFSETEKQAIKLQRVGEALNALDLAGAFAESATEFQRLIADPTRDNFRALVQAQNVNTEAGRNNAVALLGLAGAVAEILPATVPAQGALTEMVSLIDQAGISLDGLSGIISEGLLGSVNAGEVGSQLADLVIGGIRNALADSYAQQISQIVIDGIITPMVTAAATGASVTGIITDEAINAINAKADAFAAAVEDPAFVSAMDRIREALGGVANAASRAATSVSGASAVIDNGPFAIGGSGRGGDAEAFGTVYNASVAGLAFVNPFKEEVSTQFLELTKTMVDAIKAAQDEINGIVSGGYQGAVDAILVKASELREQIRSGGFESTVRNQIVDANSGVSFAEYNRSLAERRRDTLGDPSGVFQDAVDRANEAIAQYRTQIAALNATLANGPDVQPYIDAQIALLNFRNELAAGDLLGGLQREIDRLGRTDLENRLADISEQSANYVKQLIELNQATPENIAAVQAWEAAMLAAAQSATTATNQINAALARNAQDLGDRFLNEQQLMAAQYQRIAQSLTDAFAGPADGVAALTATIQGLDRAGIQDAINGILAQTDATDAMKQAGIDAANGLLDLIEQQERLAASSNGVTEAVNDNSAALQLQEQIMAERLGLERQLLEAQGDTAALAALDREAKNAANRGLYDQVIATRAATAAQAELTAQRQREADQATGLQRQLLELQGDTAALAALDREAIFGVNQGLYDLVQAARAANEAEAALAAERERITQEGLGLERQLLQERGDSVALLALDRAEINAANLSRFDELQALKAYNTAIAGTKAAVSSISGILDSMKSAAAAAADKVTSTQQAITSAYLSAQDRVAAAQQRVGDEARQAAENMTGFASNIRDFVDSLDSTDAGGGSLLQQRAALESQFAIARAQATARDPAAFAKVTDLAGRLIANLQETSGSNLEFFRDQGLIKNQLSDLAALAAAQGTPTDPLAQIASASGELAAAQAELQRLSGIAAAAGAATSATVTDLLGEYQAARTAADAASADLASALDLTRNINLSQLSQLETLNQNVSAWLAAQAIVNAGTAPFAPAIAPTPSLVLLPIANGQAQGQADQGQNQSYAELLTELRAMRAKLDQIERHAAGTKDNTLKTADVLDSAQRGQPLLVAVVD